MPIRLIAVDIDGTLLDSRGDLPDRNVDAIRRVVSRGVTVVLVTGRRFAMARPIAETLRLTSPLVVHNGALVRTLAGPRMVGWFLPPKAAELVLEHTQDFSEYGVLHQDGPEGGQMVLHPSFRQNPLLTHYALRMDQVVLESSAFEPHLDSRLIQIMFGGPLSVMEQVEARLSGSALQPLIRVTKTYYPERGFGIVDVLRRNCSKGKALEYLASLYALDRSEVAAIGDNHNDLEMLRFAGRGFVVANCVEELRNCGFEEIGTNNEAGVAEALETLVSEI
ncbi:MAG: Cof-type HAD-IIB family hydrolase [Acidobacteriota bacterium]